jgi:hypothetical protein
VNMVWLRMSGYDGKLPGAPRARSLILAAVTVSLSFAVVDRHHRRRLPKVRCRIRLCYSKLFSRLGVMDGAGSREPIWESSRVRV